VRPRIRRERPVPDGFGPAQENPMGRRIARIFAGVLVIFLIRLARYEMNKPAAPSAPTFTPVSVADDPRELIRAQLNQAARDSKGFVHRASGTGFACPNGWSMQPSQVKDDTTFVQLEKRNEADSTLVTLTWSPAEPGTNVKILADQEVFTLRQFYGNKVHDQLEAIRVDGRLGYRILLDCGPLPKQDPQLHGATYVFFVETKQGGPWKVKLRATFDRETPLTEIENLLHNYRW
jgi:hypothetical protein